MFRIYGFSGSERQNSLTSKIIMELCELIKDHMPNTDIEYIIRSPKDYHLHPCKGCLGCFHTGICPINDDRSKVMSDMLAANCVIFASPVYVHNITAQFKTLVDRLACWIHIFGLLGRYGINITVTETNGEMFVKDYLHKIQSYMGLAIVDEPVFKIPAIMRESDRNQRLTNTARKLSDFYNSRYYPIDSSQEVYYNIMKKVIVATEYESFERSVWLQSKYLDHDSFRELFIVNQAIV